MTTTPVAPISDHETAPSTRALGVVVLNFGVHDLIETNLGSLPFADHGMRLIIVDNYSSATERAAVERVARGHGWDLVPLPDNRGFSAGINAGLRHSIASGCTASIILNPDAAVDLGVLTALGDDVVARPMELVSPRIVTAGTDREFVGADVLLSSGRIRGRRPLPGDADPPVRTMLRGPGVQPLPGAVAWLTGACMAIHHDLLDRVGFLDEHYFLYWEDVDFSVRCGQAGGALVVRRDLEVRHDEAGTQERISDRAKSTTYYYYNCRNRLLFASRHLQRTEILRWMAATPAVSWEILLRGGRRQLLSSAAPATAAVRGSAAGLAIAAAAVARSVLTADRTRIPGSSVVAPVRPESTEAGGELTVTVALLTFRRPEAVAAAVPLVLAQIADARARSGGRYRFDVVVVDNDPQRSAAPVGAAFGGSVRYFAEPEPGISAGRNRAIDESGASDLLVFIDDDERPQPGWLWHLLATQDATGAAGVAGAVRSTFEHPLDRWIAAGGFFDRRRLRTGTEIGTAATNNLLLDLRQTRRLGVRFDKDFGLSGGGDTMFTRSIGQRGGLLVWCDEAVVEDLVPASRMTRQWVLARAFRSGNSWSRVGVEMSPTPAGRLTSRLRYGGLGLPRVAAGVTRFSYGLATGSDRHRARGLRTAVRGAGMAAGAVGWVHHEYTRAADDVAEPAVVGTAA